MVIKTAKVINTTVIATVLVAGMAGCTATPPAPPPDADHGGSMAVADCPAIIEVAYDNGMPTVDPDACAVDPSTDVRWRGPPGNPTVFAIKFKRAGAMPAWEGERMEAPSTGMAGYQEVKVKMPAKSGEYHYAIKANGKVLDPVIIIK